MKIWIATFLTPALTLLFSSSLFAQNTDLTVKKVIVAEYYSWFLASDGQVYGYCLSQKVIPWPIGGRKAIDGTGGFNYFRVVDDQGFVWSSTTDGTTRTYRFDTDSSGAPFDRNQSVFAYSNTTLTIRTDGSVWYFGNDDYHLLTKNGGVNMRPIQLSPKGMVVKKLVLGAGRIVALTREGQVYEWLYGAGTKPAKKTIPAPAIDIFASSFDFAGCIIPASPGAHGGYPYVWGAAWGSWGSPTPASYPQPTAVKNLWAVHYPIVEIAADCNTTHYIDAHGDLYGLGFNAQGEVGNGQETVNKYFYPTYPGYGWSFKNSENPVTAPAVQIGKGVKWARLFCNNWFSFYKYAQDSEGNLWSWGRNKSGVLGNGLFVLQQADHPNALDVLIPTRVYPLKAILQTYNFYPPFISAGENRTITGDTAVLQGVASPLRLIKATPGAANGIDTVGYNIVRLKWKKSSGPLASITTPDSLSTTVTGLQPGSYIFNLQAIDNNTGVQSVNVSITVKPRK
jgi:alpha-tubulin suppressor-like RCC1 family protein